MLRFRTYLLRILATDAGYNATRHRTQTRGKSLQCKPRARTKSVNPAAAKSNAKDTEFRTVCTRDMRKSGLVCRAEPRAMSVQAIPRALWTGNVFVLEAVLPIVEAALPIMDAILVSMEAMLAFMEAKLTRGAGLGEQKLREELERSERESEDERQIRRALEARFEEKLNLKVRLCVCDGR